VNGLISKAGANIQAQYLSTDESIGYLVIDVELKDGKKLADEIQKLPRSVRTRIVQGVAK
jgi:D-3-phosphoglycerate dehydrogenase / 2-oxoglutarate reductase